MTGLSDEQLERFMREDDGQPVVMLNLLRFHPEGGQAKYAEYIGSMGPLLARYGGEVVYAGDGLPAIVAGPGQAWDAVALVRYPTRRAFMDMIADPDYEVAGPLRMAALTDAVLQPTRRTG